MGEVIRFPVELRAVPSIDVIFDTAPDVREVMLVAEVFDLDLPATDLRQLVDAETTNHIAAHMLPLPPGARGRALTALLRPIDTVAVAACRRADAANRRAIAAQDRLQRAAAEGATWMAPLEAKADALLREAAALLILAHQSCEAARGVNRAVGMARRGEVWTPENTAAAAEWLIAAATAAQARRAGQTG